jgi:hypothetical protein
MSTTAGAIDFGVNTKALDAGIGDDAAEEVNVWGFCLAVGLAAGAMVTRQKKQQGQEPSRAWCRFFKAPVRGTLQRSICIAQQLLGYGQG